MRSPFYDLPSMLRTSKVNGGNLDLLNDAVIHLTAVIWLTTVALMVVKPYTTALTTALLNRENCGHNSRATCTGIWGC